MKDFEIFIMIAVLFIALSAFSNAHAKTIIRCTPDNGCEPVIIFGDDL